VSDPKGDFTRFFQYELAGACFQDLRTLWLADPTSPPDINCVKEMTPLLPDPAARLMYRPRRWPS
jgi:hypothetical protein